MSLFTPDDYEIIDAHAHIFPRPISMKASHSIGDFYGLPMYSAGSPERLLEGGRAVGMTHYLVCSAATVPHQAHSINTFIAHSCQEHPEFVGFGTLHPAMENLQEEIENILALGLRGIKLHPDFQQFNMDDPKVFPMYSMLEGRLPILMHMGDERYEYSRPVRLARVLKQFPRLEVIAAHFGGYMCWQEAEEFLKLPGVKFDTSSTLPTLEPEQARRLIRHFGAENMFFGTDFPMWEPAEELQRFFRLGLTREENEKILSRNFKAYFHIQ